MYSCTRNSGTQAIVLDLNQFWYCNNYSYMGGFLRINREYRVQNFSTFTYIESFPSVPKFVLIIADSEYAPKI